MKAEATITFVAVDSRYLDNVNVYNDVTRESSEMTAFRG